jgi:hypothetical protein
MILGVGLAVRSRQALVRVEMDTGLRYCELWDQYAGYPATHDAARNWAPSHLELASDRRDMSQHFAAKATP